jgi:hypothetical protein
LEEESGKRVFIYYDRKDTETAYRLFKDLKTAGLHPWLDTESLLAGQKWKRTTKEAIKTSRYFIPLLSSNSIEKTGYVQEELKEALEMLDEFPQLKIFVIPVRINDCNAIDEKLRELHIVDLFPDWNSGVQKILKSMDMAAATPEISVEHGDIAIFDADVVALKYAQNFYGADFKIAEAVSKKGIPIDEMRPVQGDYRLLQSRFSIKSPYVLFVGVPPLEKLDYREIRDFARRVLEVLADKIPKIEHVAMTIHGPGFGLDETESFLAQFAGFIDAFRSDQLPPALRHISIVDHNYERVQRLRQVLDSNIENVSNVLRVTSPGNYRLVPESYRKKEVDEIHSLNAIESAGTISETKPLIFVAMPFSEEWGEDLWTYGIERAIKSSNELQRYGFLCERADTSYFTGDIMDYVKRKLQSATVVIAELTGSNPNVYLEVGYAWGIGKPTILLARHNEELKFDVRGQRCLKWRNIQDCEKLLVQAIVSLKRENRI